MQPHKASIIKEVIDDFLPREYTYLVEKHLKSEGLFEERFTGHYIRRVKLLEIKNVIVFEAVVSIAKKFKKAYTRLEEAATSSEITN